jgi:hypothetical protein
MKVYIKLRSSDGRSDKGHGFEASLGLIG